MLYLDSIGFSIRELESRRRSLGRSSKFPVVQNDQFTDTVKISTWLFLLPHFIVYFILIFKIFKFSIKFSFQDRYEINALSWRKREEDHFSKRSEIKRWGMVNRLNSVSFSRWIIVDLTRNKSCVQITMKQGKELINQKKNCRSDRNESEAWSNVQLCSNNDRVFLLSDTRLRNWKRHYTNVPW